MSETIPDMPPARHASMNGQPAPRQRGPKPQPKRWYQRIHEPEFMGPVFYSGLLVVALVGSVQAASNWMHMPWPVVTVPVALMELGGVYMSSMADSRRRKGEAAIAPRAMSIAFAIGAAALNWFGHRDDPASAYFFSGISLAGYGMWLIRSGHRRRDALRDEFKLPAQPPSYGVVRWVFSFRTTLAAYKLAKAKPGMGLYESIRAVEIAPKIRPVLLEKLTAIHGEKQALALMAIMDAGDVIDMIREMIEFRQLAETVATEINSAGRTATAQARRAAATAEATAARPDNAVARRISRGRRGGKHTAGAGERRPVAETYALYQQIKATDPTMQDQEIAAQLGISPRGLRKAIQSAKENTGEHAIVPAQAVPVTV